MLGAAGYAVYAYVLPGTQGPNVVITNFKECAAAGYPVMESYPRQCRTADGAHFVEDIGNAVEKQGLIVASSPTPGSAVSSPIVVTGEARGTWYFEASFPIEVRDASNAIIGQGYGQAQSDWMTEDFVPFQSVAISFAPQPAGSSGTLILRKDNASGLPEHDDELVIPITF